MEQRSIFTHAYRGFTNLEYFGPHPGVKLVAFLILIGGLAGIHNYGFIGFAGGVIFSCIIYIPMLIIGSIMRSKEHDRHEDTLCRRMESVLKQDWTV